MAAVAPSPDTRRMAQLLSRLITGEGFAPARLPGVKLMRSAKYIPPQPILYEPGIVFIAQGTKRGRLGGKKFTYDAGRHLVLSVPLPFECETEGSEKEPLLGMSVGITPALVTELALTMSGLPAPDASAVISVPSDDATGAAAVRLLECLGSDEEARVLGPQLVREIVYHTLRGPAAPALMALAAPGSHAGRIGRVLNLIHTEYARALDMPTLAREAGMSVSAFHSRFREMTASSPLQYLKNIRLHKARMLMVNDGESAAAAAGRVGYESASQFSREFRRHFGATPGESAARLRGELTRLL